MFYVNSVSFLNKLVNRLEIKLKRTRLISRPVSVTIEPTVKCNSNCIMCNRNFHRQDTKQENGMLGRDTLKRVKPFIRTAERIMFGGFGEPFLHPEYTSLLKEIKRSGGPFVYVFTNGIVMTPDISRQLVDNGFDMVCISMGGANRESYRYIRGVDAFDRVVENIRFLHDYKRKKGVSKPLISFNIVSMNSLLDELPQMIDLAAHIGVGHIAMPNLVAQGESIRHESNWLDLAHAKKVFAAAEIQAAEKGIQFIRPDFTPGRGDCKSLFNNMIVNWDGTVMSCSQERFILGDLKKQPIQAMWNSPGMIDLRKKYYKYGLPMLCPACTSWDNRPETYLNPWKNARQFARRIDS